MRILVAYDGSEQAEKSLQEAMNSALKTVGASLTVITVIPDLCLGDVSERECASITGTMTGEVKGFLKKAEDELASRGIRADTVIRHGNPAEEILRLADEIGANLIVIGSHGKHAAERLFFGSVSTRVVQHSKCNVLVIK